MNDIDSNLKGKISQLEDSLGLTFEIFYTFNQFSMSILGNRILIQENQITALNITKTKIRNFSAIFDNFSNLVYLRLSECDLSTIPHEIMNLPNLRDLGLQNNHIRIIPEFLFQLYSLKSLNLSSNQITLLPENIGNMLKLKLLDVSDNAITLLPPSLSLCTSLHQLDLSGNPLVSLAGIPSIHNIDVSIGKSTVMLTFKGCILTQISRINQAIQMDHEYSRYNNRQPKFSCNSRLSDIHAEEILPFVEALLDSYYPEDDNLFFPRFPPIPCEEGVIGDPEYGAILPEFRTFLISFLEHISDYNEDSWKDYYARHPIDIAQSYIKSRTLSKDTISPVTPAFDALSKDDYERLVYECDYRLYNFLKDNLVSSDPLLQDLHGKFSVKLNNQSLFL